MNNRCWVAVFLRFIFVSNSLFCFVMFDIVSSFDVNKAIIS